MSTFACADEEPERKIQTSTISDAEIYEFISSEEDKKPSTEQLQDRIEDLEFELDCCKEYNKEIDKRIQALKMLLQAIDVERFEGENKKYLEHILEKIKYIVS